MNDEIEALSITNIGTKKKKEGITETKLETTYNYKSGKKEVKTFTYRKLNILDAVSETNNYRAIVLLGTLYMENYIDSIIKYYITRNKSVVDLNKILERVDLFQKLQFLRKVVKTDKKLVNKCDTLRLLRNDIAHILINNKLKYEDKEIDVDNAKDLDFLRALYVDICNELNDAMKNTIKRYSKK